MVKCSGVKSSNSQAALMSALGQQQTLRTDRHDLRALANRGSDPKRPLNARSETLKTLGGLKLQRPCAEGSKKFPQEFARRLVGQLAFCIEFFVSPEDQ